MAEPAEKRQKTGEGEQAEEKKPDAEMKEAEAPKVAEPPKELEVDAPACSKPKLKEPVTFLTPDTTLNLMQSAQGNVLMSMNEGGIRHFFAGARANVGVSKGRYMFEVKIMEFVNVADASHQSLAAKNVVRVGFSTQGSSLVLGSGAENICFDSAGAMLHNDVRTLAGAKCFRDSIMTVLLNLDKDSPNFNTVSLFKDGKRACQPQPLPDSLKGKTLFPHVSFKNATVHVNFGAVPLAPLPFTCRMVQDATKADTSATKHEAPADGKYEVVYPVSLPDEGTFDWLDTFLEKNKSYTELSDRAILNWASQSGLWRQKGHSVKSCNDRPDKNFQAPELNDDSVRKAVYSIAPLQARNYIVMEVKGNLMEDERKLLLDRFRSPAFKKIACVVVGEPTVEFKKHSQKLILQQKQEASDKQFNAKKLEEKRKKIIEQKQKEMEKLKKKAEKEKKQKEREAKKKAAEEKGEKLEEEDEEKEDEEEEKEEAEEEEKEEEPPKAELTAEEKKMSFVKRDTKDLTPVVMSASFTKFTLPTKDEGFDDIKYEWTKGAKCDEYVKKWILERKLSMRIEDLQPSTWFNQQWAKWQMAVKAWQSKLAEYKTVVAKKAAAKAAKEAKKAAAAKKAAEKKEGDEKEEKKEDTEAMEVEEEEKEEEEESIDFEALDVFGVDDILNVGAETPLFKEYQMEDWAMLSLRFELHILAHAFRKDVNDPERMGIHLDHLAFYYNRYFKKALSPKDYGVESFKEIVDLVDDAVYVTPRSVLGSLLDGEMETFAIFPKLAEEARRHRGLRLALGEESAQLKLSGAALQGQRQSAPKKQWGNAGNWQSTGYQQGGYKQQGYGKAQQQGKDGGKGGQSYRPYGWGGNKGGKASGKGGWTDKWY
mmetsp:Transcript_24482/g.61205  ORF Transcript_24482/g.61205 Transcript_24482/m.61205 type:complete len:878 (+) Transcript_24482:100-2733(+)